MTAQGPHPYSEMDLEQWFQMVPSVHLAMSVDTSGCHEGVRGVEGGDVTAPGREARDAAKQPSMYKTAPTMKN